MKLSQDAVLGLIFMAIGLSALYIAIGYPLGTTSRMGPGYFPVIISLVLTGVGATLLVRSRFMASDTLTAFPLKPIVLITAAIVLFGLVVKGLGMPIAVLLLVLVAATSSLNFKLSVRALAGAVVFSALCTLIFVSFLHMSIPLFGTWLQGLGL